MLASMAPYASTLVKFTWRASLRQACSANSLSFALTSNDIARFLVLSYIAEVGRAVVAIGFVASAAMFLA